MKKKKKEKNKGGRPPIWTSPLVLQKLVDEFFKREKRITLAGLAVALDISRSTLYEYEKKDKFSYIIKKARERVEELYEEKLVHDGSPTGVIFALKNMGWSDNRKVDHTTQGEKIVGFNYLPLPPDTKIKNGDNPIN